MFLSRAWPGVYTYAITLYERPDRVLERSRAYDVFDHNALDVVIAYSSRAAHTGPSPVSIRWNRGGSTDRDSRTRRYVCFTNKTNKYNIRFSPTDRLDVLHAILLSLVLVCFSVKSTFPNCRPLLISKSLCSSQTRSSVGFRNPRSFKNPVYRRQSPIYLHFLLQQ